MAYQKNNTGLTELLLQCMSTPDPMPRRLDTRMGTMYLMVPKLRGQAIVHSLSPRANAVWRH